MTPRFPVLGQSLDAQTRCAHWHSALDIVAMRFKCCGDFYACHACHQALAGHTPIRWQPEPDADEIAALCGQCHATFTVAQYLGHYGASGEPASELVAVTCPHCNTPWNPACRKHRSLYFELPSP